MPKPTKQNKFGKKQKEKKVLEIETDRVAITGKRDCKKNMQTTAS
jgi:hypothetical protein